jgi:hypothetical protein
MALSALDDKTATPDDRAVAEVLGPASALWDDLRDALQAAHGPLVQEWNHSGKAYGWSLRLKQKSRTLVYMTPCREYFLASCALGEKACRAAHESRIAPAVLAAIDAAPRYAEGRGIRIDVRRKQDVHGVRQLVAIKASH